jgi:hypothetical protein
MNKSKIKKGGSGGKGTWGKGGLDDLKKAEIDEKDPNYNSEEETDNIILTTLEIPIPSTIDIIIDEYFISGDIEETVKNIEELNLENEKPQFIKKCLVRGMEKQAYEKELICKLLLSLYDTIIEAVNISKGFQLALDSIDDLILDIPDGVEILAKFLARAIIDEILPPSFLKNAIITENSRGKEVIQLATGMVTEKHKLDRLAHIWGPGDLNSVKRLKEETDQLLEEYLITRDLNEADKCVRKLNTPSFHFQLVKQALKLSLRRSEEERKKNLSIIIFF